MSGEKSTYLVIIFCLAGAIIGALFGAMYSLTLNAGGFPGGNLTLAIAYAIYGVMGGSIFGLIVSLLYGMFNAE